MTATNNVRILGYNEDGECIVTHDGSTEWLDCVCGRHVDPVCDLDLGESWVADGCPCPDCGETLGLVARPGQEVAILAAAVDAAYQAATGEWAGLDWHDPYSQYDEAAVEAAAQLAEDHAAGAMECVRHGYEAEARKQADAARDLEADYGDAPVWGPFQKAVEDWADAVVRTAQIV